MQNQTSLKTLRTIAVTAASMVACTFALAQPGADVVAAMASVSSAATVTAAPVTVAQLNSDFEAVLAQALSTPTAAGNASVYSRGLVEAVLARHMVGMIP